MTLLVLGLQITFVMFFEFVREKDPVHTEVCIPKEHCK